MPAATRRHDERGIALVTVLLLLVLTSTMLAGFLSMVSTDARLRGVDRTRTQAFYAAHAGLEKLTADLGDLFATDFSPEPDELETLEGQPPDLESVSFAADDGLGYDIAFTPDANGNPAADVATIETGPYQGLRSLKTPYTLTVTARMADGAEARLRRTMNTVSIPVFQFGVFSETDLSFFAGPNFSFGGRVHTNGNLFLASGATLTLSDRVTALGEVVRTHLSNGWSTNSGYTGTVRAITAPGAYRNLARTEGSLVESLGSAENEPTWTNLSIGTYNGNVRNGRTGARELALPLLTVGGSPIDIIRRPVPGEEVLITEQRLFAQASIRILLSDTADAIVGLPDVSPGTVDLSTLATAQAGGYVGTVPPALSSGVAADGYRSDPNTPLIGGQLKVEYRDNAGTWRDVTAEILNLGFSRRNIDADPNVCAELHPNAILRLQRMRETPAANAPCGVDGAGVPSANAFDYWPLALYDTREGTYRDNNPVNNDNDMWVTGVMHYVELDVNNLRRWLAGEIGASGPNVANEDGFVVYFSDRRGNRDAGGSETGEFGFEDFVNRNNGAGLPDSSLETGEDVNGNGALDVYGGVPVVPPGATGPLNAAATPRSQVTMSVARVNRPIFFRRALKIVNAALGSLPADGLTLVSENPVYVEGHFNANAAGFGPGYAPAAIIADAVTLLSADWSQPAVINGPPGPPTQQTWHGDTRSFLYPNNPARRRAATTWYRFAVIAGKGPSFPQVAGTAQDFGTDGGIHNFLRYLESWSGRTLNYRGAMASFYFNRQAVGTYKCCQNVYSPPTRGYAFDTDFLDPTLLPPKTPMFRDVNTTGFTLITR
ncbi:MAG: hypothetical protein AB1635_20945 [Acidobacteriota bacterium]